MEIVFSQNEISYIDSIIAKYPSKEAAIMPVLWFAQNKFKWISTDVVLLISKLLDVSPSKIEGVTSFYTMFHTKPVGKYHIQVCTNVSCMLRQGIKIFNYISDKYNIVNMQTTPDGLFSLEEVECMGACGGAPMIAINEDYYENITIDKLEEILVTCN